MIEEAIVSRVECASAILLVPITQFARNGPFSHRQSQVNLLVSCLLLAIILHRPNPNTSIPTAIGTRKHLKLKG